jgi:hypothetical protein
MGIPEGVSRRPVNHREISGFDEHQAETPGAQHAKVR